MIYSDLRQVSSFLEQHRNKALALLGCCYCVYLVAAFAGQPRWPYLHARWLHQPLANDDYIQHYAYAVGSARALKEHGRTWCYSARHHAGYPADPFHLSNLWATGFVAALGAAAGAALAFNLAVFAAYLLAPLFAFLAACRLRLCATGALLFTALCMFLIIGEQQAHTGFSNFIRYGMYGWTLGVFVAIYAWSLLCDYLDTRTWRTLFQVAIFGALALLVHPLSAVVYAVPAFFLLLRQRQRLRGVDAWRLGGASLFVALSCAAWWYPVWRFSALNRAFDDHLQTSLRSSIDWIGAPLFLVIAALFAHSALSLWREGRQRELWTHLGPFVVFFLLAALGTQLGAGFMQPLRMTSPLCVLACLLICAQAPRALRAKNLLFAATLAALFALLYTSPSTLGLRYGYDPAAHPEVAKIVSFIKRHTSAQARLHVQDQRPREHLPSTHPFLPGLKTRLIAYLPGATGREILAGPCSRPTSFQFSQFLRNRIFGKPLTALPYPALRSYLALYNVKYLLVSFPGARAFFDAHPRFKRVFHHDTGRAFHPLMVPLRRWLCTALSAPRRCAQVVGATTFQYTIYEHLGARESYCYKCDARVEAADDRIKVSGATQPVTILKYHYIDTLRVKPDDLEMGPVKLLDDPVPFIRIKNGRHRSFVIFNP